MARHNRTSRGEDQFGHEYTISFQPDWLHQVKVTRDLQTGRQSTKTLFRNTDAPAKEPGTQVRTGISAPSLGLTFQVALDDPRQVVRRIVVEAVVPEGAEQGKEVVFTISRQRVRGRSSPIG